DEVSMVRADLLDSIDVFLRKYGRSKRKPFGGIRVVFIGDLYQLPPVVRSKEKSIFKDYYRSPYFFDAKVFEGLDVEYVELQKVYRQSDDRFLDILNAIRNKTITEEQLELLNSRVMPEFEPSEGDFYIYLTTTNKLADEINRKNLKRLRTKKRTYKGKTTGDFEPDALPAPLSLELKAGAQVMLLNNDPYGRWINGTMGMLVDVEPQGKEKPDILWVELEDGSVVDVLPHRWEMFEYHYDKGTKSLITVPVGTYEQYPLRLAWAITIHKSQGLTFDRVIIDIGRGTFSHGQVYVALSRCRSLDGLVLKKPLQLKHIWLDRRVVQFITSFQYHLSEKEMPLEEKVKFIQKAIKRKRPVEIVYLKAKDERSKRVVLPLSLEESTYKGSSFLALRAFCHLRSEERTFNVKRILELREIE
ncbi:MAG: WYL domain-containing protein, partial [Nitrospirae bacterium]